MNPIYLDYAASTPIDDRVLKCMQIAMREHYGNSTSLHHYGVIAKEAIESARNHVANLINAQAAEIIWTSGATESINLALKGTARLYQRRGRHIVTMKTEHKAVLDACQALEQEGFAVTYLSPQPDGVLDMNVFRQALRSDTSLVSIMLVNNEVGTIQNMAAIAEETNARGILLHVDAVQAVGKIKVDVNRMPIDLLSMTAHKLYGPKGIGALYLRRQPRVRVSPLLHGGGHEMGLRSGTLATHQIVGMGEAFRLAQLEMKKDAQHVQICRDRLLEHLRPISQICLTTNLTQSVPHIVNIRFNGMLSEALITQLPEIAVSTASACQGKSHEGSYVLHAMGYSAEQAKSAIRFSFGRFTTLIEIDQTANLLRQLFGIEVATVNQSHS